MVTTVEASSNETALISAVAALPAAHRHPNPTSKPTPAAVFQSAYRRKTIWQDHGKPIRNYTNEDMASSLPVFRISVKMYQILQGR